MSYLFRRFLLFLIIFIFLLAAPLVCFYARGYRFDFHALEFTKTGTISIKTIPRGASIYLNNKLDPNLSPTKIDGLKPKDYTLKVTKPGYQDWQATLTVKPELVTSATHIILFPEKIEEKVLTRGQINNFNLSPDQKKIIYNIAQGEDKGLWIFDLDKKQNLKISDIYFDEFDWSEDSQKVILTREEKSQKRYGILNLKANDAPDYSFKIQDLGSVFKKPIEEAHWQAGNNQRLFLLSQDDLYEVNFIKPEITLLQKNIKAYAPNAYGLFWIQEDQRNYSLVAQDYRLLNRAQVIASLPAREEYKIIPGAKKIAVLADNDLFLIQDESTFQIASNVIDAIWSPDGQRLLYFNEHQLGNYYLKDEENIILTRDSRILKNVGWWPRSQYITFTAEGKLKFLDAAPEMNTHYITEIKNTRIPDTKIYWSKDTKGIFVLSQNGQEGKEIIEMRLIED
ncbi:MAG: PEGA domain-containing protein [Candidatus Doudnabacteria bacterium]